MRIKEYLAGDSPYRWDAESIQNGKWVKESTTGLFFWNYFGKRSQKFYQNKVLVGRMVIQANSSSKDRFEEIRKAIKKNDIIAIRKILESGVDPNLRNERGWTPLMVAALKGNKAIIELFLSSGADPNLSDCQGDTAVLYCACTGHYHSLKIILNAGGRIDSCQKDIYKEIKFWNWLDDKQIKKITGLLDQYK